MDLRRFGRRVALVSASGFVLMTLSAGCRQPYAVPSSGVRPVKTMVVTAGEGLQVRTFPGRAEASRRVELAFQVAGLLVKLPVKEGQKVAKGEVIAQLRQDEFEARLTTLQGQLDQSRAALRARMAGERPEERLRRESQVRAVPSPPGQRPHRARAQHEPAPYQRHLAIGLRLDGDGLPRRPGRIRSRGATARKGNDRPRGRHRRPRGGSPRAGRARRRGADSTCPTPRCAPRTTA